MSKEISTARQRAYSLFSRLYLEGVTAGAHAYLQQIPELAGLLPHPFNADEAAAGYHSLFHFNLLPYESVFLGEDGLLGSELTGQVTARYQAAGFRPDDDAASPDHLGVELSFMAFLGAAEAQAWAAEQPERAARLQEEQAAFLLNHLLRWLPPLAIALRRQTQPFYAGVGDLTLALAADHLQTLAASPAPPWQLPPPPALLSQRQTGLKEVAGFLMTPAYSGFYMGRDDVTGLARRRGLPRGFGKRAEMLTHLMKAAAAHDQFPQLIGDLLQLAGQWEQEYLALVANASALDGVVHPWPARCRQTMSLLTQIKETEMSPQNVRGLEDLAGLERG